MIDAQDYDKTKAVIADLLSTHGWQSLGNTTDAVAEKTWETAVGPHKATLWLSHYPAENLVHLTGEYWSKGNNVLSTATLTVKTGMTLADLKTEIEGFNNQVEERVSESFARRLLLVKQGKKQPYHSPSRSL